MTKSNQKSRAIFCGGASFGRSEGGAGDGDVESERSFGGLSGCVRSERSGALSEVSFGGGGSVAGVSYARSEGCGASLSSGDGDCGGCGVMSGLPVGAASELSFGAMSEGAGHAGVQAEDSGLQSEASFGALSCGGASFGRSQAVGDFVSLGDCFSGSFRNDSLSNLSSSHVLSFVRSMISLNSFCDFKDFPCPSHDVQNRQIVSLLNSPLSSLSVGICGIGVSVKHVDGCFLVASLSLRGSAWQSKCIAVGNRLLAINGQ